MSRIMLYGAQARAAILEGVNQLADAVGVTLGPRGRNVVIEKQFGAPTITKDGVTVAREVNLEDPFENMGAQMVKEVASKTNDIAGDGTTTATVLAQAIYQEGVKLVASGVNPMAIKRGIDKAVAAVVEELEKMKVDTREPAKIAQVATISANGDTEIGQMLAEAMEKIGKDGVITVEEGSGLTTKVDMVEGMQFDKGFLAPHFTTNPEKLVCELENPFLFIYDGRLDLAQEMVPVLQQAQEAGRPLLIIAEDVIGEALTMLVVNKVRGVFLSCAVRAPGFGDRRKEQLQDLAVLTAGSVIGESHGRSLKSVKRKDFGQAKRVVVSKDNCTIIDGAGEIEAIEQRKKLIHTEIQGAVSDWDREKLEERLAKLAGGVAVIKVGGATEIEMRERKMRFEDSLHATRAAVAEGIVPGGGVALIRAAETVRAALVVPADEQIGAKLLLQSCCHPARMIATNAGVEGTIVVEKIKALEGNHGYNAETSEYVDLVAQGVIDPKKVVRCALQNAASIAGLLLTTECVMAEKPEPIQPMSMPMPMR